MSASRPSRSPSPAQAPPVQQTPGPRAAALQKLYSDAVSHTLRTCSYSNFASSFPTPASHAPDAMKRLHTDFVEKLDRTCRLNFDQILRDRQVVASLNDLDRLVEDARKERRPQSRLRTVKQHNLHSRTSLTALSPGITLTLCTVLTLCRLRLCTCRILAHFFPRSTIHYRQDCRLPNPRMPTWSIRSCNNAAILSVSFRSWRQRLLI